MKFNKIFALFLSFSMFLPVSFVKAQDLKNVEQNINNEDSLFLPQIDGYSDNERLAIIKTNMGNITVRLFPEFAPKAVENFIALSQSGYYNGVTFHRVIKDFMIQSGDPTGTGAGGQSIWGEYFDDEISTYLRNFRGALCMANAGPNTNGSQFYIVQHSIPYGKEYFDGYDSEGFFPQKVLDEYSKNGGCFYLDGSYTVFGQVLYGLDVVDSIAGVETNETDRPFSDIIIDSISVIDENQNLDKFRLWSLDLNKSIIILNSKNDSFKTSFDLEKKEPFSSESKYLELYNKNGTLFVSTLDLEKILSNWEAYSNYKNSVLSVPNEMKNDVLFVPLRAVLENLGMDVFYDDGFIGIFDKNLNYSFDEFLIFKDIYK